MAKFIQYIGTSHVRKITKEEWAGVGVHKQDGVQWDRTNAYLVPLKDISDAAWPFIEADPELVVVDRLARDKPDQPDPALMGAEATTGYLETLRTEDAADVTAEEVSAVPDQHTGSTAK